MRQLVAVTGDSGLGMRLLPVHVRAQDGAVQWAADATREHDAARELRDGWQAVPALNAAAALRVFVKLGSAPEVAIEEFARRHGVLMLDTDGAPLSDAAQLPRWYERGGKAVKVIEPTASRLPGSGPLATFTRDEAMAAQTERARLRGAVEWYCEPLDAWREWARYFAAVQTVARELRRRKLSGGRAIAPAELPAIFPATGTAREGHVHTLADFLRGDTLADQWAWLTFLVSSDILSRQVVRESLAPMIFGPVNAPRLQLEDARNRRLAPIQPESVFPALAAALAGWLLDVDSDDENFKFVNSCSECGEAYGCHRRDPRGRCPDCRVKQHRVVDAKAKREKRAKARSACPAS